MMKINVLLPAALMVVGLAGVSSCEDGIADMETTETVKDITGSWKVIRLTRNGEDLSQRLDLSDFRIQFNTDGSYTLAEQMPFIADAPGTYKLSDPQYPFALVLQPEGAQEDVVARFQFPVVKGERQLSLSFSLGCESNTYQFNFERENQDL
ncbi:DUF5004 domain-containing protein [Parapedobacter sp. 10938]|uniref:DUF5004 domain-containing protein n=1 Tax=Parapedobacter flavus TaxID=3110225 RepID=UPI002DBEAAF6|nr:DUF5004 domain-containing protein [Parapedobacter sp. 10938]MEC3878946.1 DUF5004 domain-containing protein [Parapedobacter sp. 10938]